MSEVVLVELEALELAPENMREADPEALEALKASIQGQGLLQNLVGYVDEEEGVVRVVAGGHRLRALKELGWAEKVPVRLVPREKAALLSLAENLARKELSPLEEAEAVARLLERHTREEIARELGRTPAWVEARARVARDLVPEAKEALGRGEMGLGLAALLAELPEEDQKALWKAHGKALTPEMVRAWKTRRPSPSPGRSRGGGEGTGSAGESSRRACSRAGPSPTGGSSWRCRRRRRRPSRRGSAGPSSWTPPGGVHPHPGGATYVVLYSGTGEVKVYAGVRRRGERLTQEVHEPEGGEACEEAACPSPLPSPRRSGSGSLP